MERWSKENQATNPKGDTMCRLSFHNSCYPHNVSVTRNQFSLLLSGLAYVQCRLCFTLLLLFFMMRPVIVILIIDFFPYVVSCLLLYMRPCIQQQTKQLKCQDWQNVVVPCCWTCSDTRPVPRRIAATPRSLCLCLSFYITHSFTTNNSLIVLHPIGRFTLFPFLKKIK
uniref:Uncharacterized protein n=1 Tax=Trypanosoma vivax (strain Y486) TaxID=1055687 RepID=G0U9F7_TRYVY|nr:hypothetical protein TVY486_1117270 [Trypanosoma vivax Y486]